MYIRQHIDALSDRIATLYRDLGSLPSLEPDDQVNLLFSELVTLVLSESDEVATAVLDHPKIKAIRADLLRLCSTGEYLLERHWSRRIVCSEQPHCELLRFPYYRNYTELTRLEYAAIAALRECPITRVLFVGAGPLPLTSRLLAQQFGLVVDNLDSSQEACELASQLANRLNLGAMVRFYHGDAADYCLREPYDVVTVAALAGLDRSAKARIVGQLARQVPSGRLLVARTAHHLRLLLYPQIYPEDLVGFRPRLVLRPRSDIINSVIIAEKS